MSEMFCFQCQQTAGGSGCGKTGVCGKQPETARLQDAPDICQTEAAQLLADGHDLGGLHQLLEQTTKTGVNVYPHCEMLPAHGYSGLKKYPHLANVIKLVANTV